MNEKECAMNSFRMRKIDSEFMVNSRKKKWIYTEVAINITYLWHELIDILQKDSLFKVNSLKTCEFKVYS